MPIYEYKGQRYDIADTDPAVAKAKILKHLGETAPTPAPEAKPAVSQEEALATARMAAGQGYGSALTGNVVKGLGTTIPESFKQGVRSVGLGVLDTYPDSINQFPVGIEPYGSPQEWWASMGITSDAQLKAIKQKAVDEQIAARKAGSEKIAAATPQDLNILEKGIRGGIESLAANAPGLGAALLTRQPALGLGIMGTQTGAESYGSAREAGKTPGQSALYGGVDAAIEVATEALPTKALTKIFGSSSTEGIKKKLIKYAFGEMGGEEAATFLQSINAQAHGLDEELANAKTAGEQARIHAERAAITAIATLVQGGVQGGVASIPAVMGDARQARDQTPPTPPAPPAAPAAVATQPTAPAAPAAPAIKVERLKTAQLTPEEEEKVSAAVDAGIDPDQAKSDVLAARQAAPPAAPKEAPPKEAAPKQTAPTIQIADTDSSELKEKKAKYIERQAEIDEEQAKKDRGEKFAPLKIINKQKANTKLAQEIAKLEAAAPTNAATLDAVQRLIEQNRTEQEAKQQAETEVPNVPTVTGGTEQPTITGAAEPVVGTSESGDVVPVSEQTAEGQGAAPAVGGGVGSTVTDVAGSDVGEEAGKPTLVGESKATPRQGKASVVRPTEDQIYSANDKDLASLLYEAHVDPNGDLLKGGLSESEYAKLSGELKGIDKLPKNQQIGLRVKIGDAIAKAHGLGEEAGETNAPDVTAMANEGMPTGEAPKRKRGRPKGSKNKPKEGVTKQQSGAATEVVVDPTQVSSEAPKQTTKQLSPEELRGQLEGKSILDALNHVISASSNPLYRLLAGRVKPVITAMVKAGVVMAPIKYGRVKGALGSFEVSRIDRSKPFTAKNLRVAITLTPGSGYSTLMHELLHTVTVPLRIFADLQGKMGVTSELTKLGQEYHKIGKFVSDKFAQMILSAKSAKNLDSDTRALLATNFPDDSDEVFAWALSSDAAWNFVNKLPYDRDPLTKAVRTVGDWFVVAIRKMLNLPVKYNSALHEILNVTARMADLSENEIMSALEQQFVVGEKKLKGIMGGPKFMAKRKASPAAQLTAEQLDQQALETAKQETAEEKQERSLLNKLRKTFSNETLEKFEERNIDNRRAFAQIQTALDLTGTLVLENVVDAAGKITKGFNNVRDRIWASSTNLAEIYKERLSKQFDAVQGALSDIAKATGLTHTEASKMADFYRKMLHLPERRRTLFMLFSPLDNKTRDVRVPKPNIPNLTADEQTFLGITPDGTTQDMTPAAFREFAVKLTYLNRDNLDPYIQAYRSMLMELTEAGGPNSALDSNGSSLANVMNTKHNVKPGGWPLDINDQLYTPLENYTATQENDMYARFMDPATSPHRDLYLKLFKILDDIQEEKKKLDKEANFWSTPVENISKLYGWKNYVPLTGRPSALSKTARKEYDALEAKKNAGNALTPDELAKYKRLLKKLEKQTLGQLTNMTEYSSNQKKGPLEGVEITNSIGMSGRTSASDNVVSAVLTGAVKAAMRLARRDTTQAIVNLINTKSPTGRAFIDAKLVKTIPFHDRFIGLGDVLVDEKGQNLKSNQIFLHYTGDGTVQVYKFSQSTEGQRVANALRSEKNDPTANALFDKVKVATGYLARMYTAYNATFLVKDLVRNMISLGFTATSDNGKRFMAQYAGRIAGKIASQGWFHAARASYYYQTGGYKKLEEMAKKYPYRYKNLYDFLVLGKSDLTLLSEFTSMSQSQRILERIASQDKPFKYWAQGKGEDFRALVDITMRAFNLMFQAEAFAIIRNKAKQERGVSNEAASLYAGQYIKDLGNFQKTGRLAEQLGGFYAFVRSGAVGSIRFTNSIKRLFVQDVRNYLYGAPQALMEIDPTTGKPVYNAQMEEAAKKYSKQKFDTAVVTLTSMLGLGIIPFLFAAGGDGDDDEPTDAQGRNTVKTDDLGLWTRGMRIPKCRLDPSASCTDYYTIPYGYGYGAFAGIGVQMAAWAKGYQDIGDATVNIGLIGADNFLPIQPARFNPFKPIGNYNRTQVATFWLLDTISPTVLKGPIEYAYGVNGLGQQVGAGTSGRYGDPYLASESTPEVFNDAAAFLSDVSDGAVTLSPETLRTWANIPFAIADEYVGKGYNLYLTSQGKLDFDIRNVPGAGAFSASRRDPVPGKFYDVKRDVDEKIKYMDSAEAGMERGDKFAERRMLKFYEEHPEMYQYSTGFDGFKKEWGQLNAELNQTLSDLKAIKAGGFGEMAPAVRKRMVKEYEYTRDNIMDTMTDSYRMAFPKDAEEYFPKPR